VLSCVVLKVAKQSGSIERVQRPLRHCNTTIHVAL